MFSSMMFSSSICSPFVALVAYVAAVSAAPGLFTAPSLAGEPSTLNVNSDGLENIKVTVTIANTGGETLKLFNDPSGDLNSFLGDISTPTDPSGSRPSFDGAKVDYNPTQAAGQDDPSKFTVLAPGGSVSVVHDRSVAYDLIRSGVGDYSIEPSNLFTYVDADGTPKDIHPTIEAISKAKLSGNIATLRHVHEKRAAYRGCTIKQKIKIHAAYKKAKEYATAATAYLQGISAGTTRYETWFGAYDPARHKTVLDRFAKIKDNPFHEFTYDCSECTAINNFAEVYPDKFGVIWFCPRFWKANLAGPRSRAGTLIHEASHFIENGGTTDIGTPGETTARRLARYRPASAINNADNYAFFVETSGK